MRLIRVATAIALIALAIGILGVSVIDAKSPRQEVGMPASHAIDVMQMMIHAKDLPIERFDAH